MCSMHRFRVRFSFLGVCRVIDLSGNMVGLKIFLDKCLNSRSKVQ